MLFRSMSFGDGASDFALGNHILGASSGGGVYLKNGGHVVGGANTFEYCGAAVVSDRQGTYDERGDRFIGCGSVYSGENLKITETTASPADYDITSGVSSNDRILALDSGSTVYNLVKGSAPAPFCYRRGRVLISGVTGGQTIQQVDLPKDFLTDRDVAYFGGRFQALFTRGNVGASTFRFTINGASTVSPTLTGNSVMDVEWFVTPLSGLSQQVVFKWSVSNPSAFLYPETAGVRSQNRGIDTVMSSQALRLVFSPFDDTHELDVLHSEIFFALKSI